MRALAALLLFLTACASVPPPAARAVDVELPYTVVTLDNGLRLVMQPDPAMPLVGAEVWTRGGSREEAEGQHGIAHLFEHDLPSSGRFLGNAQNRAIRNGTTRGSGAGTQPDFLRFYLTSSPDGLEAMLGYLGDRLESDTTKFTDAAVKRDQDIVLSELRRSMGSDWDTEVLARLHRGTFGAEHPYGHAVQGSEADVKAATAETMREWHRRYAGASNAIVFVAGNFEPAAAERMVRQHFGSIPAGERAPQLGEDVPAVRGRREVLESDVTAETAYMRWPVPSWGSADADALMLFARILGEEASVETWELAGQFTWRGDGEVLQRRLRDGISERELARAKAQLQGDFVRMLQQPVWRGSRADVLGYGLMWRGDAGHYKKQLARIGARTTGEVMDAARRWLAKPGYELRIVPRRAAPAPVDRGASIAPVAAKPAAFPPVVKDGQVLKVERTSLPLAQLTIAFDAGTNVEAPAALTDLGATVTTGSDADFATLSVSVLSAHAEEAARILAGVQPSAARKGKMALSPSEQRYRALDCLIATCEPISASAEPRAFIASGDVGKLGVIPRFARDPLPATELRVPPHEIFQIIDYPTATQAHILLAQVLPSSVARNPLAASLTVSYMLRSRLMDNLRSAKGWSYEVYPFALDVRRGGAVARFNIPVQTDKTAESIAEVRKEIARLQDEPVPVEELATVKGWLEGSLTAGLMSLEAMNKQLLELARNDLPADYYSGAIQRLAAFTPADVQATARELLRPDRLIWIIAGERSAIERELRELGVEVNSPQ